MQAYRIETTLAQGGILTLTNLPFQKGEAVEVIILRQPTTPIHEPKYRYLNLSEKQ